MEHAETALPRWSTGPPGRPERDKLLVREKAHTRAGDAIAAARCRLPMVEMDPTIPLIGPDGPVPLLEVFEGRRQLVAYFHMWHREFMGWDVPWYSAQESAGDRVFETYWTTWRGFEVMAPSMGLLDMTVHGRQETGEDSPAGWPQPWAADGEQMRTDGRPTPQLSRVAAGRSDDPEPAGD